MIFHPQPNRRPALPPSRTPHQGGVCQPGQVQKETFFWHLYLFFSTFVFTSFVFLFLFWLMNNWLRISDMKNNCLTNTLPPREQSESPGPQSPDRYYSNFQHLDKNTHVIIIFCHHLAWLLIKSSITPKQAFLLFKSQSPSPSPTLKAGLITRLC